MKDFTAVSIRPNKPGPNKALVLFAHGRGFALYYEANSPGLSELIQDTGGGLEDFDLEGIGAHCETPADGLYVYDIHVVDDGPGDWPGSREVAVELRDGRPVTVEEWAAHRRGEYPWGSP